MILTVSIPINPVFIFPVLTWNTKSSQPGHFQKPLRVSETLLKQVSGPEGKDNSLLQILGKEHFSIFRHSLLHPPMLKTSLANTMV